MWDDSDMAPSGVGGKCLNSWQASKRLKDGRGALEEVVVSLAHDAHLAGAVGAPVLPALVVRLSVAWFDWHNRHVSATC